MGSINELAYTVRRAFQAQGFKEPVAILLASPEEGMRFLAAVQGLNNLVLQAGTMGTPKEHPDGSVWMSLVYQGVEFRWPARKYALEAGGYVWQ